MTTVSMGQCWANVPTPLTAKGYRCHNDVPQDPDHIGLCDDCIERLRDPDFALAPTPQTRTDGPYSPRARAWAQDFRRIA